MTDLAERMSKMKREHGGHVVNPTVADLQNKRQGIKEKKRDALYSLISKGEPESGIASQIGRIRRMKRRSR
jgi:hypothetical protein